MDSEVNLWCDCLLFTLYVIINNYNALVVYVRFGLL